MEEFGLTFIAGLKVWGLVICVFLSIFVVTVPITGWMIIGIFKSIYNEHTLREAVLGFFLIPLSIMAIAAITIIGAGIVLLIQNM